MKQRMPTLFIGHGSPMNALEHNAWTQHLKLLGEKLPLPRAIVCVSAHWVTASTKYLNHPAPRTIHDFYGFPDALYKLQYPAAGYRPTPIPFAEADESWGFDHGTWSVLRHLYPDAQIPVTQLSLSHKLSLREHYQLAQQLRQWRDDGILILGSGNITHNLREVDFSGRSPAKAWAQEFDGRTSEALTKRDLAWLWAETGDSKLWQTAHPTLEHYWPLMYIAGVSDEKDRVSFPFEQIQLGSLSMRTVLYHEESV